MNFNMVIGSYEKARRAAFLFYFAVKGKKLLHVLCGCGG